jgi:hypothetical protein
MQKLTQKWIKDLTTRPETMKVLKESIVKSFYIALDFLDI